MCEHMTASDTPAADPITNGGSQRKGFGVDVGGSGVKGGVVDLDTGLLIGERFKLAINKASIGWVADPAEPTRDTVVMKLLSRLKAAPAPTDEDLALLVMEVANCSSDIAEWLEGLRSAISEESRL